MARRDEVAHCDTDSDGPDRGDAAGAAGMHPVAGFDGAPVTRAGGRHRHDPRARGAGDCHPRFASCEKTLIGPSEAGAGLATGNGPTARLPLLVGRGRALEVLLLADDLDGPRAEVYGYANRAIADAALDDEVDAIASRLARFVPGQPRRGHGADPRPTSPRSRGGPRAVMVHGLLTGAG